MNVLKAHIDNVLLPAIYCQNLRSVEIVQGFLMLAAYLRPTQNPSDDRSWTLLGHAIRVCDRFGHALAGSIPHTNSISQRLYLLHRMPASTNRTREMAPRKQAALRSNTMSGISEIAKGLDAHLAARSLVVAVHGSRISPIQRSNRRVVPWLAPSF